MSDPPDALSVEATGETVGEAKWMALRELERRVPALDKSTVRFQVIEEGERGLLGVGYSPARVVASVDPSAAPASPAPADESTAAAQARRLVERITASIGVSCRVGLEERDDRIVVTCTGGNLGLLIGRRGQTIDAIQYLANAIAFKGGDAVKRIVVDAAGYRARREETLHREALRAAERALADGRPVALDPMTAVERKVVHERLKGLPGIETSSEGSEPNRHVVVVPAP